MGKDEKIINNKDIKDLNIYEKIDLVRNLIKNVEKTINLSFGKVSYRAVAQNEVVKAVNAAEHEARLLSFQESIEIINNEKIESMFWIRMKAQLKVVNIDKPDEFVYFVGFGDGLDVGDKACGKANTYAIKYALLNGYKLSSSDDPDQETSEELIQKAKKEMVKSVIKKEPQQMATIEQIAELKLVCKTEENFNNFLIKNEKKRAEDFTFSEIAEKIEKIKAYNKKKESELRDKE